MAKDQGADKTEQPTAKKLRDARKDANVSKSKELTSTVLVLGWLVGGWMMLGFMWGRLEALFNASFDAIGTPFAEAAPVRHRGVRPAPDIPLCSPFPDGDGDDATRFSPTPAPCRRPRGSTSRPRIPTPARPGR